MNEKEDDFFSDIIEDEVEEQDDVEEQKSDDLGESAHSEEETDGSEKKETEKLSEEEQRRKNKDAEEARKRREREAKEKAEAEKKKLEEEKQKETASKKDDRIKELGKQLYEFSQKYPDIDIATLDADKNFKNYLEGKLLGRKDFTALYEDYIAMKSEIAGKEKQSVINDYLKADASSGSSQSSGKAPDDVFTEDELNKIAEKLPTMNYKDAQKIREKFYRSVDYYKKRK